MEISSQPMKLLDVCRLIMLRCLCFDFKPFFEDCKAAWSHDSASEIFWLITEISTQAYDAAYLNYFLSDI
jgi:hypothetical protein